MRVPIPRYVLVFLLAAAPLSGGCAEEIVNLRTLSPNEQATAVQQLPNGYYHVGDGAKLLLLTDESDRPLASCPEGEEGFAPDGQRPGIQICHFKKSAASAATSSTVGSLCLHVVIQVGNDLHCADQCPDGQEAGESKLCLAAPAVSEEQHSDDDPPPKKRGRGRRHH